MDAVEHLGKIECECERADALAATVVGRDELVDTLDRLGFGRPGQAIPTDWKSYYSDEELRDFILVYAAAEALSA